MEMQMPQATINVLFTGAQRKVIVSLLPHLSDRLTLDEKGPRTISFTEDELEAIQQTANKAISSAAKSRNRNSLWHVADRISKAIENAKGIGSIPATRRLYQFKITLQDVEPTIWRRIHVKGCTLHKLHEHIQAAMGWTNSHLYEFEIDGERYGNPSRLDDRISDFQCVDSTKVQISEIVPQSASRFWFFYRYDMGDRWEHEILFEGCLPAATGQRYPLCVEGEMNCPPEDVGGFTGYAEFLEALADPKHEMHDDFVEEVGDFDWQKFDAEERTKAMRQSLG